MKTCGRSVLFGCVSRRGRPRLMKSEQVRNKLVMKVGMPARIATIASPVGNGDNDGDDDDDDANAWKKSWANIKEGGNESWQARSCRIATKLQCRW